MSPLGTGIILTSGSPYRELPRVLLGKMRGLLAESYKPVRLAGKVFLDILLVMLFCKGH